MIASDRLKLRQIALNLGTDAGQPGAGLGLSIVRCLVELLNGRIELESEVGSGTCFSVILPIQYARLLLESEGS